MPLAPRLRLAAMALTLCLSGVASAIQTDDFDDEAVSALMGELIFQADLMNSLEAVCPQGNPARDWRAALPALPPEVTTPDVLELSRQLAISTGRRMRQESGGCATPAFAGAYAESRQTFGELIERWRKL